VKPSINGRTNSVASYKAVAVAAAVFFLLILPLVVQNDYVKHLLIMACIGMALGMTFAMFYSTGLISLGAAAFYGLGAYISATLAVNMHLAFWYTFPLTIILSAMLALGFGSVFVRNAGITFVIISLLFAQVVVVAAGQIEFLGGWGGLIGIPGPTPLGPVQFTSKTSLYYLVLAILFLIIVVFYSLYNSRIGRAWKAIKLSPNLAGTLGINPYRYRLLAFVIGSTAAAAIGSFYAHYSQTVAPGTFGGWLSIYIQLYAVLGGLEFYILGPIIGSVIMTFVPEYLRVIKEIEPIITGALLLVIILFIPGGILGSIKASPALTYNGLKSRLGNIKAWLSGRDRTAGG
jgi:branched-chain amino acid transport system permease protein